MLHSTLLRQLRKVGADRTTPPAGAQWQALLEGVSEAYAQGDSERCTSERSIEISSQAMGELNARLGTERDRLHVTIASIGAGLCVLDSQGKVEIANRAAEGLLGTPEGKLVGKDFIGEVCDLDSEENGDGSLRELGAAILSRESKRGDAQFRTLGGSRLPVSFVLTHIDGSRAGGSVLVFVDNRARNTAQAALLESEARFRAIFELAAVGMVRLGLDGRIFECNSAFCEMVGHLSENTLGKNLFSYLHEDDVHQAREHFEALKLAVGNAAPQLERRYVNSDGSVVWAMQALSLVRSPEGAPTFAIGVIENVTARKNLEISLRQAQKLEAVGQLAAGIAHEINTPVQFVSDSVHFIREAVADVFGVLASYRALREAAATAVPELAAQVADAEETADVPYLAEQLPKALDRALDGLQRVATIVRGMKEFAHPDCKDKTPADLNHALETTLAIARNEYKYVANVVTEFGELPPVTCHVGELNQVFLNILVNAAHAIADVVRSGSTKGCIRIKTWRDADSAVVAISDTGGGIPEAARHRIFEPFFTTKEVGRGTGQGLAIARAVVVDKHDGELTFETAVGRGTTFLVRLPIEPRVKGARAP